MLAASSSIVGCFTFLRKKSLIGDAIAHSVLPGVCLAFLFFETKNPLILLAGATVTGWVSVVIIDLITSKSRIKADAAIGLVLSVFFGVGILLLTHIQHSGIASQSGLESYLFGKAASMTRDDIKVLVVLSLIIIVTMILFYKEFALMTFDEDFANSIGLPVKLMEIVLSIITVFAVAVGIQAVGVVLMAAMLIAPAAAGRYWTDKLRVMIILAAAFGTLSGLFGAFISYTAPNMPTGPWIVIVISIIALCSILFAPNKGYMARRLKQKRNQRNIIQEDIVKLFYKLEEHRETKVYGIPDLLERRYFEEGDLIKRTACTYQKEVFNQGTRRLVVDSKRIFKSNALGSLTPIVGGVFKQAPAYEI